METNEGANVPEAKQTSRAWGMGFYIAARLVAAYFEWSLLAFFIGAMKAQAGIPAGTPVVVALPTGRQARDEFCPVGV